jgi:hypothetical protein
VGEVLAAVRDSVVELKLSKSCCGVCALRIGGQLRLQDKRQESLLYNRIQDCDAPSTLPALTRFFTPVAQMTTVGSISGP